ncbi:helix-turn-helix domain-containing protein [Chryseobacterium gotjawalense]|uniref:Helix-turn-helix domain-containing protein n=1 Tax=Chryseobacterium gotjawalense TaxID=3042315 RepID=A0ABY8RH71_9FLAO|nr:helix-turn-helix domain-containing protein [Chryseobacterium sp. wdc7]WHF52602.1 helix-turn-helix domain-containing protein [Chryseobacterium sp. wdc7]
MWKKQLTILLILCYNLIFSQSVVGFKIPDSLKNTSGKELTESYDKVFRIDNVKSELYANAILRKGKMTKNSNLIYDGYYKLAHVKGLASENGHPFADSLLQMTKNFISNEYPAKAHIIKGTLLYYDFKYSDALDYFISAQKLAKDKNKDQFFYVKKLIGILKTATGENEEALPLFIEYYRYEKNKINNNNNGDTKNYIGSIFSLSNSYSKNEDYNKSRFYSNLGLKECHKYKDYTYYTYFILSDGVSNFYLKNYKEAIKSFLSVEKELLKNKDYENLAISYYFLGKTYDQTQKEKEAINYFLKTDSLSFALNKFLPVTRDGYERLIDYFKKDGNQVEQLKYINHLFYADSVMAHNNKYIAKDIYKKYDTPILLQDKELLINKLANKNNSLQWFLLFSSLLVLVLTVIYFRTRERLRRYQKQAVILLENVEIENSNKVRIVESGENRLNNNQKNRSTLSEENYHDIKTKITHFESSKGFIQNNLTLGKLAEDLDTNRDYLSKFINEEKGKNFSQYLNELRINYILLELKNDKKLRKYTISAIASEVGFSNSESFSNAFKRTTGTLPSFYIKLLEKDHEN